jgi:SAM-dependent methyltransferase
MASSYTATDAVAYERLMGRWSGRLADKLIAFAGINEGDRVLDVGCGTGSMALALAARAEPSAIVGIGPTPGKGSPFHLPETPRLSSATVGMGHPAEPTIGLYRLIGADSGRPRNAL